MQLKQLKFLENKSKEYIFEVQWGIKTNSGDIEGTVEKTSDLYPTEKTIKKTLSKFKGDYFQEPQNFPQKNKRN